MEQILNYIGNTPLYKLKDQEIYIKLEKMNIGGSIKDRTIKGLLLDAIENKKINEFTTLVEATSGNTGISIALLASILNIKAIIIMPENMSKERMDLIKAYGATLMLSKKEDGMQGALLKQEELLSSHPNYLSLNQFDNPANPNYHYQTTAKEIIHQLPDIDIFTCGIGTGGSFSGISKALKEYNPAIKTIAIEPNESPVISKKEKGTHQIQGIGAGFIPKNLWIEYMDEVLTIDSKDAINEAIHFSKETGILVGFSSGANIYISKQLAKKYKNKKILTLAPDGLEKYLSLISDKL